MDGTMSFRAWVRSLIGEGKKYANQQEAADAWKTGQSTVAHYLRGSRTPDLERCIRISEAEDMSPVEIAEMVRRDAREPTATGIR